MRKFSERLSALEMRQRPRLVQCRPDRTEEQAIAIRLDLEAYLGELPSDAAELQQIIDEAKRSYAARNLPMLDRIRARLHP
jgi:hypothetical protein